MMTLSEIAKALGVHRATVHQYVKRGLLAGEQLDNRTWLVDRAEFERFLADKRRPKMGRPKKVA